LKISINSPITNKSFGGGGLSFVTQFQRYLKSNKVSVINHLDDNDIDFILIVNVTFSFSYSFYKAALYKISNPKVIIIHRVNDSGYQRNNNFMTNLLTSCSSYSDHLIYVSSWLYKEMIIKIKNPSAHSVILNGVDIDLSNVSKKIPWDGNSKLKIITHHWSANYSKGHEFYQILDGLLNQEKFKNKFEFTYIGNYPKNLFYQNTKLLPAMPREDLAEEIRKHDVYLSASKNEAGGMHIIEGISLGLPTLYIDSGGTPEYAEGCGLMFTKDNFEVQIQKIHKEYFDYYKKIGKYSFSGYEMSKNYLSLFQNLLDEQIIISSKSKIIDSSFRVKLFLIFKEKTFKFYRYFYVMLSKYR